MSRFLNVYLNTDLVGLLEQDKYGELWFTYDLTWLHSSRAVPLSISLPLRQEKFKRKECRPFFAGLLPEENSRQLIARAFGVSDKNDFALLEKIGRECAGAVSLQDINEVPEFSTPPYREISMSELAKKLSAISRHPLLVDEKRVRLSLAGAQGKMALRIHEGRYLLALDGAPSTHILKPQSPHFAGLVENEYFCMTLGAEVGLDVARVEIGESEGQRFLQIERYDRHLDASGSLQRLHQEDFCQALGIPPEMKYQQEGGPGLKQCFDLLRFASSAPGPDMLKLFDAIVFNYLIGNSDAHGKNFALLYGEGGCRLAPLYDLVCTRAYEGIASEMAMKLGGEKEPTRLNSRNWLKFIEESGLGRAAALQRLRSFTQRVKQAVQKSTYNGRAKAITEENCARLLAPLK